MKKVMAAIALVSTVALGACKKTGEGEYQIEKPVMGTVTDTLAVPTIDVGTQETQVSVPKIEVNKDPVTIKVPKIEIKSADDNAKR